MKLCNKCGSENVSPSKVTDYHCMDCNNIMTWQQVEISEDCCKYCDVELEDHEPGIMKCPECGSEFTETVLLSDYDLYLKNCI